jgi:glycolate oxidase FAD binding subunit
MIAGKGRAAAPKTDGLQLGGRAPSRVVEPADAHELAAALAAAAAAGESVVAFGGGTLQHASNPPRRYNVAVRTTRLTAIHDYDPRDLTCGVGAGMTLAALARALAQHAQFLPLDAPHARDATLGGTLAAGWSGPRRAAYGRPRDLIIGATVALADGSLAASGGMVVKNVTGYDMAKLYIGSHGTLGLFTRVNFKLLPQPAVQRFAASPFDDESRERLIEQTAALTIAPTALLLRDAFVAHADPDGGGRRPEIAALFEGSASSVERAVRDYRSALGAAGVAETRLCDGDAAKAAFQSLLDAYVAAPAWSFTLLGRGLPSDAPRRALRVRAALVRSTDEAAGAARGWETITDLLTGDVVARFACRAASAVDEAVAACAAMREALGTAQLIACSDALANHLDAWGASPATLPTMRALKARFDPDGVLAPGRFIGGI